MDPEMSDVKKRTRSSNVRKRANGYYLAIRACKVTRVEDQVKAYIMKSRPSEVIVDTRLSSFRLFRLLPFQISAIVSRCGYRPRVCNYDYLRARRSSRPRGEATTKPKPQTTFKTPNLKTQITLEIRPMTYAQIQLTCATKRLTATSLLKTSAQALLDLHRPRLW